jgi:hypothetical protein
LTVWFLSLSEGLDSGIIAYRECRWGELDPPHCERFRPWVKDGESES